MQMTHLLTREVRSKALGNRARGRARERHRECSSARSPDHSAVAIGSYPFFDPQHGPNTNVVLRAGDARKLAQAKRQVEEMLERVRRAQSKSA